MRPTARLQVIVVSAIAWQNSHQPKTACVLSDGSALTEPVNTTGKGGSAVQHSLAMGDSQNGQCMSHLLKASPELVCKEIAPERPGLHPYQLGNLSLALGGTFPAGNEGCYEAVTNPQLTSKSDRTPSAEDELRLDPIGLCAMLHGW